MELKRKILNTIKERKLINEGDHLILGLSGGPDSLCLFNVLRELLEDNRRSGGKFGLSFTVHPVHLNHRFRPGAAEEDQEFCEETCRKAAEETEGFYKLRAFVCDCGRLALELGMTSEEAGRKARYDAFRAVGREVMEEFQCEASAIRILVAQNADDQAETILFRILRGTGPDGLSGIRYEREDESGFRVVRPILGIKRAEIEEYCALKGLEPRIDHTNRESIYARNKIRLELLPYLEREYNPNIVDTLIRLGRLSAEDREHMTSEARAAYERLLTGENTLSTEGLSRLDAAVRKRVYIYALNRIGMTENITEKHLLAVDRLRTSRNHPEAVAELAEGFRVAKRRKEMRFYRCSSSGSSSDSPAESEIDVERK